MEKIDTRKKEKGKWRGASGENGANAPLTPNPGGKEGHPHTAHEALSENEKMKDLLAKGEHELNILRSKADFKKVAQAKPFFSFDPSSDNIQRQETIVDFYRAAEVQFGTVEGSVWADRHVGNHFRSGEVDLRPLNLSYHPDLAGVGTHLDTMRSIEMNLPTESSLVVLGPENATEENLEIETTVDETDDDWLIVRKA